MTDVAEIAEDRHEPLGLEGERVHIDLNTQVWREENALVLDLVREERSDDAEESRYDIIFQDDVSRDGRNRE